MMDFVFVNPIDIMDEGRDFESLEAAVEKLLSEMRENKKIIK